MNMTNFNRWCRNLSIGCRKKAPEIWVAVGIVGGVVTVVTACRATIKATDAVRKREEEEGRELTTWEKVQTGAKYYILPAATGVVSGFSVCRGVHVSIKRTTALAGALAASESKLEETIKKTTEIVGPKKAGEIQDKVAQAQAEKSRYNPDDVVMTGYGDDLFYEPITKHWLRASINFLDSVKNDCNFEMREGTPFDFSEWTDRIGLGEFPDIHMGWDVNQWGYMDYRYVALPKDLQAKTNGEIGYVILFTESGKPRWDYDPAW